MYGSAVLDSTSPVLTLKVLPALVRLVRTEADNISLKTDAISTLGKYDFSSELT